ncbi:TadA family conjugal transfer-associated ATPase [Streptomyces sp. NP160]|uniref:TadA family conjugal transfer-associated ATPase n=1 Tax=Streptomyces sp. NP160 TaxID=2586637 RepID=UPI0027D8C2CD|nr:TadA family conjugal transfer-associated ATPase [Streptomyces sp. NP160]
MSAGPLQELLDLPGTTDVLVNGPGAVWADRGDGLVRVDLDLGPEPQVRALAVRLAAGAGRRLDDASPCVDAVLADGTRLHAVLPPVSGSGTLLSLRVPRRAPLSLADLDAAGSLPPGWADVLRAVVRHRCSTLVSGGTGSGKTTLLGALLGLVDPRERMVLVEDSGELSPAHPHVVRLQARHGNVEGAGAVGQRELVRQALRMRPDRLVVGEVRGAEVADLLMALNSGHEGGSCTVHANSASSVPARLTALAALAGMGPEVLAAQAAAGLQVVVHLRRDGGLRRVVEVGVVSLAAGAAGRGGQAGLVVLPALRAGAAPDHPGTREEGWGRLAELLRVAAVPVQGSRRRS